MTTLTLLKKTSFKVAKHGLLTASQQTVISPEVGVGGPPFGAIQEGTRRDVLPPFLAVAYVAPQQQGISLILQKSEGLGDGAVVGGDSRAEASLPFIGAAVI